MKLRLLLLTCLQFELFRWYLIFDLLDDMKAEVYVVPGYHVCYEI